MQNTGTLQRRQILVGLLGGTLAPAVAAPRIRVGCQTRAYGSPIPDRAKLLSVLDDLRAAGYEGFETNFNSLKHSFQDPAPMREEIEKRGIALIGLHMGASLVDPENLESEQTQIREVAAAVKAFGGTHLILSVRALPEASTDSAGGDIVRRRAIQLDRAGRACRELGVRLSVHNHLQQALRSAEELRDILSSTSPDYVSLLLDIAYTHMAGLDTPSFVREHGRRIAGLHLRDMRGEEEVEMGAGEVDFRGLARVLEETRWSGWCILEINRRPEVSSRDLVEKARIHMRNTMNI